jgi:hypothetical protein
MIFGKFDERHSGHGEAKESRTHSPASAV